MSYRGYTEAQKRASIKWMQEKTDDIRLRVPKGTKERWKDAAGKQDKSMTVYVYDAVDRQIAFDESGENEIDGKIIINLTDWLKEHGHTSEEIIDCLSCLADPV